MWTGRGRIFAAFQQVLKSPVAFFAFIFINGHYFSSRNGVIIYSFLGLFITILPEYYQREMFACLIYRMVIVGFTRNQVRWE